MLNSIFSNINKQQILDFANIFYIQIAIAIVVLFFIFRSIIAKTILSIVNLFSKSKTKTTQSPLYKPLKNFIFVIGVYLASLLLPLNKKLEYVILEIFKIISILFFTKIITVFVNKDSRLFKKFFSNSKNEIVNSFICKITRVILWLISFIVIFKELGFDLTGLVAGLGVGSVIISLAAQDTVKSLLSGVTILTEKPFEIGDWIKVGDYQGSVLDITFKSTRIKANDNTIITIPNSMITEDCVINWNKLKSRRFDCTLNFHMDTTSEQMKNLMEKIKLILKNNPDVDADSVNVVFDQISTYSLDVRIFLYINEAEYIKYINIKEKIHLDLLELIDKENLELAYPTQTIYLGNNERKEE